MEVEGGENMENVITAVLLAAIALILTAIFGTSLYIVLGITLIVMVGTWLILGRESGKLRKAPAGDRKHRS
jgi:Na+-translocating ferredoxin:NAD+ oxidoreductase RnfE subunit